MKPDRTGSRVPWTYLFSVVVLAVLLTSCASGGSRGPFDVTVTVAGDGVVTSEPAGIDCPGSCADSYPDGTDITLTATPDAEAGASFEGRGGDCSGTSATCSLEATSDRSVDASFSAESGSDGLEASLNELGVDTTRSDRLGPDGEPLPDSWAVVEGVEVAGDGTVRIHTHPTLR